MRARRLTAIETPRSAAVLKTGAIVSDVNAARQSVNSRVVRIAVERRGREATCTSPAERRVVGAERDTAAPRPARARAGSRNRIRSLPKKRVSARSGSYALPPGRNWSYCCAREWPDAEPRRAPADPRSRRPPPRRARAASTRRRRRRAPTASRRSERIPRADELLDLARARRR